MFYSYGVYVWICPSYLLGEQSHLIDPGGNFLVQWTKRAILFLCSNLRPREKKNCHKNMVTFLPLKLCWCLGKDSQNEKKKNGDITGEIFCSSPCNSQSCLDSSLWMDWEQRWQEIHEWWQEIQDRESRKLLSGDKEMILF